MFFWFDTHNSVQKHLHEVKSSNLLRIFRKYPKKFLHKKSEQQTHIISIYLNVEIMAKIWN